MPKRASDSGQSRRDDYRRRRELAEARLALEKQQAIDGRIPTKRDLEPLRTKLGAVEFPGLTSGTPIYPGLRKLEKNLKAQWAPLAETPQTGEATPYGSNPSLVEATYQKPVETTFAEVVRWAWIDKRGKRVKAPTGKPPKSWRQIPIRTRIDKTTGKFAKPIELQPWTIRGQRPTEAYRLMVKDVLSPADKKKGGVERWRPMSEHDFRKPCQVALYGQRKDANGRMRWVLARYLQVGAQRINAGEAEYFRTMTHSSATPGRKWAVEASGASVAEALAKVNWGDVFEAGSVVAWAVRMRGTTKDGKPWVSKDLAEGVADNRQGGQKGEDSRYNARDAKGYIIQDHLKGVFSETLWKRDGKWLVRDGVPRMLTKAATNVLQMAKTIRQAQRSWQVRTYDAKRLDVMLDRANWQPHPMVDAKTGKGITNDKGQLLYRDTYNEKEAQRTHDQWASFLELREFRLEIMLEMIQAPYEARPVTKRKPGPRKKPTKRK